MLHSHWIGFFSLQKKKGTKRGVQVHGHVAVFDAGGEGGGAERSVRGDGHARRQSGEYVYEKA